MGCIWSAYFSKTEVTKRRRKGDRDRLPNAKLSVGCNEPIKVWDYVKLIECKGETEGPRV